MVNFVFPNRGNVVADIVLIAWRRVDTLRTCLEALLGMTDSPPFGVRIAANGASDEVKEFLRTEVAGAVVVETAENIGFGGGCNAAASGSTAEHLVFLNDDTAVGPDWLAALVAAAERTSAAAVSSLLVNEDGEIHEAGVRILADSHPLPFASGLAVEEARALGLLETREIDYGSAAALLVRREVFERVGGFDLTFSPAYYEDVDLCFRIKAAGGRVEFAPDAVVTHFTGASTRDRGWYLQYAVEHGRNVFLERWQAALETAPAADAPVSELIAVGDVDAVAARGIRDVPTSAESVAFALRIERDYACWLEASLDAAHLRMADFHRGQLEAERKTESVEHEAASVRDELGHNQARVGELVKQIDSLTTASAVNLLRWQRRARRARR